MLKLETKTVGDMLPRSSPPRLHGERLTVVSGEEDGKWPLGRRLRMIVLLAIAAWLAVLYLPGLLTELAGYLLDVLLRVTA
jgi:hypothetical protein